jgi:ferredoxin
VTASFPGPTSTDTAPAATVTIQLDGKKVAAPLRPGETLLEIARIAGMAPPFSCEAGNCGTCMAKVTEGSATMRINDALDDDEVDEGYVLTCQAVPDGPLTVSYDD